MQTEFLSEDRSMRFCGFELSKQEDGIRLSQERYIRDLLKRYDIEEGDQCKESAPLPKLTEEDMEGESNPQDLHKAQSIVGELLCLSTRTRPDLSFRVGGLGRMVHKNPKRVCELGMHTLRYLSGTADFGLLYLPCVKGDLGEADHLQLPRAVDRLEVYADVSYSPSHEAFRSIQGIAWESCRQPFICHSTAESELVSYSEGHQIGESVGHLLSAVGCEVKMLLYGDNCAAIISSNP